MPEKQLEPGSRKNGRGKLLEAVGVSERALDRRLTQRQFLRTLAGALGVAGISALTLDTRRAEATYYGNESPNRVDTDLRVQGVLTVDGNVGVGNSSPTGAKIVISRSGGIPDLQLSSDVAANTWGVGIRATGGSSSSALRLMSSAGSVQLYDGTGTYTLSICDGQTTQLVFRSNGNSYFNGGNVGIGTSSPAATLDVAGDAQVSGNVKSFGSIGIGTTNLAGGKLVASRGSGTPDLEIASSTNANPWGVGIRATGGASYSALRLMSSSGSVQLFDAIQNYRLTVYHGNDVGVSLVATGDSYLKAGNRLGVGTSAPVAALDVDGDIHATGTVKVNGTVAIYSDGTARQSYYAP